MFLKKYLLLPPLFVFNLNVVFSQLNFQHLIGGSDHDRAQTIFNTFDNGFIINGASFSFGAGNVDATLIKTDSLGQIIWSYAYGTTVYDNSEFAIETSNHDILCAGRSNVQSGFPTAAIIFKTDSIGHLLWSKSYGGTGNDNLVQLIETSDNGYAAVGYSESLSSGSSDILLIRTDVNGDTLFTRSFGSIEREDGLSIIQLPDNGFIIIGRQITFPAGKQESDGLLLRTDASGNLLWAKQYGDSLWEELTSVRLLPDNGFIFTGSTSTFGAGNYDILLMKTDSSGNVQWSKTFGNSYTDAGYDIHITNDFSYILSGYTESLGYGHKLGGDSANIFLMKTNVNGDLQWMETYGDGLQDEAFRSAKANDGGYLIPGFTNNYLFNDSSQMVFIKTDSMGLTGCHEESVNPIDSVFNMPFHSINFNQLSGLPFNTFVLAETFFNPTNDDACLFTNINSNISKEKKINIFPNPFNNKIEISTDNNFSPEGILIVNDAYGKIIKSVKVHYSPFILDMEDLESGIYFASLITENEAGKGIILIKY